MEHMTHTDNDLTGWPDSEEKQEADPNLPTPESAPESALEGSKKVSNMMYHVLWRQKYIAGCIW